MIRHRSRNAAGANGVTKTVAATIPAVPVVRAATQIHPRLASPTAIAKRRQRHHLNQHRHRNQPLRQVLDLLHPRVPSHPLEMSTLVTRQQRHSATTVTTIAVRVKATARGVTCSLSSDAMMGLSHATSKTRKETLASANGKVVAALVEPLAQVLRRLN